MHVRGASADVSKRWGLERPDLTIVRAQNAAATGMRRWSVAPSTVAAELGLEQGLQSFSSSLIRSVLFSHPDVVELSVGEVGSPVASQAATVTDERPQAELLLVVEEIAVYRACLQLRSKLIETRVSADQLSCVCAQCFSGTDEDLARHLPI